MLPVPGNVISNPCRQFTRLMAMDPSRYISNAALLNNGTEYHSPSDTSIPRGEPIYDSGSPSLPTSSGLRIYPPFHAILASFPACWLNSSTKCNTDFG